MRTRGRNGSIAVQGDKVALGRVRRKAAAPHRGLINHFLTSGQALSDNGRNA
jgi:hypothetical protein